MFDVTDRASLHPGHGAAWFAGIGVLDVVAGIFAVSWPGATVLVLALLFGFLLLMAGIVSVSTGLMVRRAGGSALMPFLFGGAAVIAGIICLLHPGAGVFAIIVGCSVWFLLTGLSFLIRGAGELALGWRLRGHGRV